MNPTRYKNPHANQRARYAISTNAQMLANSLPNYEAIFSVAAKKHNLADAYVYANAYNYRLKDSRKTVALAYLSLQLYLNSEYEMIPRKWNGIGKKYE